MDHHRVQDCTIKTVCGRYRFNGHHTLLHLTDREWKRHAQPPQTRHRNFGRNSPASPPQERTYGWRKPPVTPRNSAHTSPRRVIAAASLPSSPLRYVQPGPSFQRRNSTGMMRGNSPYGRSLGYLPAQDARIRHIIDLAGDPPQHPCSDDGRDIQHT